MRLTALMLAAMASATLVQAAAAQTNTTGATSTAGGMSGTSPATQGPPPTVTPDGATPAASAPAPSGAAPASSGAAFRPLTSNPSADIASVLAASGQFTILLKAVDATGLTPVLKTTPGITVFAPTDAAFGALPPAALDLKDPANLAKLQALLTYHVINAKLPPIKGHSATAVETVATGKKVTLDGTGEAVKVNDATALQGPVNASNGVIYPIDKVLSPDYVAPPAAAEPATTDTTTTTTSKKKSTKKKPS